MKSWHWFGVVGAAAMCGAVMAGQAPVANSQAEKPGGDGGQTGAPVAAQQLAILDTDIGDDIDDAFALALLLNSPEVKLLGVTTEYGDTELRARLVERFLESAGRTEIPVAAGVATDYNNVFTQARYAEREPVRKHADGVEFLLDAIEAHPGEITLIAIGPQVNIDAAIKKDPDTFKKLKRVVMMGGSVYGGYGRDADGKPRPPEAEWNIKLWPAGPKALLASGVPVYMMPLDSTQIPLEVTDRERIFSNGTAVTDQLALLYHQWYWLNDHPNPTPTLFDPVAAAYAMRPELCPTKGMRIEVDEKGMTLPVEGEPNAQVCLEADRKGFVAFLADRITK
jgi:inosine-uridine nucleoside N-ribohydrolase